jgi:hypothetical protein
MVRNHDSLQEIPNMSIAHAASYDVDNEDDYDAAATYTIAHLSTAAGKTGTGKLNDSNCRIAGERGGTDLLGNERSERRPQQPPPPLTTAIPTQPFRNSVGYNTNFTAWKRKKDSKIVGLKNYGLESPRHQLHNTLSDLDDHYSSNSKCHATTQQQQPSSLPKRNLFSWWMRDCHRHHPYCFRNNNNATTTTRTNVPMTSNNHSKHRLFAVEKEEERVRKHVTKNPFVLFYLGNLAAIKVLIYYFSKFWGCHTRTFRWLRCLCRYWKSMMFFLPEEKHFGKCRRLRYISLNVLSFFLFYSWLFSYIGNRTIMYCNDGVDDVLVQAPFTR